MTIRRNMLRAHNRDYLVHCVHDLSTNGCLSFIASLAKDLPRYGHVVAHETPVMEWPAHPISQLQQLGIEVVQVDRLDAELLQCGDYTGAMLYNIENRPGLGDAIPSIYYSYGVYDPAVIKNGPVVACSQYAATTRRWSTMDQTPIDPDLTVPPFFPTRQYRRLRMKQKLPDFSVGLLTSGAYSKYPGRQVVELLGILPPDIPAFVTTLPRYRHPGVEMAIQARREEFKNVYLCPVLALNTLYYVLYCDALVYSTADGFNEPYGRLVVEAMACGIPIICERRGVFPTLFENNRHVLFYDTTQEAINHIDRLRHDKAARERLAANGQLWASWQDTTAHIGTLRRIMQAVGM